MEYTKYRKEELTEVLGTNVVKVIKYRQRTNVGQKVFTVNLTQPVLTGPKSYCVETLHEPRLFHLDPSVHAAGKGKQEKDETFKEKETSNWSDLPSDIMINILQRIHVIGILRNVQNVCTKWQQICMDPCMWRVISLDCDSYCEHRPNGRRDFSFSPISMQDICKNFVDQSQGQLVDISMKDFCDDKLLQYVAERSSQLRRLEIGFNNYHSYNNIVLSKALKKFPLLEELSLDIEIPEEAIQTLGRDCPMLKTIKLSKQYHLQDDALGLAIAGNLPGLRHLQLISCKLTDTGLQAILDRCCHLQVLGLQRCYPIDLTRELEKRCSQQIKCVKFTD